MMAGVLFEDMATPRDDTNYYVANPSIGLVVALFPQGQGRVRAYIGYPKGARNRFQGRQDIPRFIEESVKTGAPADFYRTIRANGPLATFAADDTWVELPYREGVALIGDAAAASDPSYL